MATKNLEFPRFRYLVVQDGVLVPAAGYKVYTYKAGTTDALTTYTTADLDTPNANPVILDADGSANIFYTEAAKIDLQTDEDAAVTGFPVDNINPTLDTVVSGNYNLVLNGDFEELASGSSTEPANWVLSAETSATIAIDSTVSLSGSTSIKFDGGGSGGGSATSTIFDVKGSSALGVEFSYISSHAGTTNTVVINWFDAAGASVSSPTTVYTDAGTSPTSWSTLTFTIPIPAAARQAKLVLTGVSSGGANLSEDTWFDGVIITSPMYSTLTYGGASAAGTDTYAGTLQAAIGSYEEGQKYSFEADVANTGACTINFNSVGAANIKLQDGTDPYTGAIIAGMQVELMYDGTNMVLLNPDIRSLSVNDAASPGILLINTGSGAIGIEGRSTTGTGIGVRGQTTASTAGATGVNGIAASASGATYGVLGTCNSATGYDFYANGSGTNYGPFTGSHDGLTSKAFVAEIGDIVVDTILVNKRNLSNTIFEVELSTEPNQVGPVGVLNAKDIELNPLFIPSGLVGMSVEEHELIAEQYNLAIFNSVGEGQVNVCGENGNISKGDLIVTSSVSGKGMKQSDNIVRSYTVAKARESVTFTGSEIKQIACIYLCG